MKSLFGIPMNDIMIVMLALLAISAGNARHYRAAKPQSCSSIGVRNIPRRMAQTVLIIIGLMLSTTIISAAFTTGDTVDHSITKMVYDTMGHVDETIQRGEKPSDGSGGAGDDSSTPVVTRREALPQSLATDLEQQFQGDSEIAGFLPLISEPVAVSNPETKLHTPVERHQRPRRFAAGRRSRTSSTRTASRSTWARWRTTRSWSTRAWRTRSTRSAGPDHRRLLSEPAVQLPRRRHRQGLRPHGGRRGYPKSGHGDAAGHAPEAVQPAGRGRLHRRQPTTAACAAQPSTPTA